MSKAYTKTIITINLGKNELVFGGHELPNDIDIEAFLRHTYEGTVYLKLNKSFDIFNNITQAVIKATNGKKAILPINQVDEIYVVNRLLLQTVSGISKLKIKESRVFYKPKHLKGILKDFKLDHVMSNDEDKILQALRCPKPLIRKHIYGMPVTRQAIVGGKEIPIEPLTPADMERIMKEAGVLKIKPGEDLNPFYSFISPARRTMFKEATEELNRLLSTPNYGAGFVKTGYETSKCNYSNLNKTGKDEYYVVFCTGTDTVESFSVNDNELEKRLSVLKETQQHKFLDLSNLSRIPVVKKECKELTTELLNFVLDKLPSDIVNKVVRIVFNISFLDKYRDEYIKTNDKQLFFSIDHIFRKPGFDTESYINFKQCDLSNFMLETNSGILKLKVKGEI